ncbi:hypothetical protein [Okeania sp.]|nr:hypothetical protein [Okeania sp.]MEB3342453.1 hypothetical protein [Okeania sp.]
MTTRCVGTFDGTSLLDFTETVDGLLFTDIQVVYSERWRKT